MLVNGGGSVTLSFQRQPFRARRSTVMVPWNRLVTMDAVVMVIDDANVNVSFFSAFLPRASMLARYMLSSCVRPSVRHKPVLYLNDWTNRAGLWHGGFLLHCVKRKCGYIQILEYFQRFDAVGWATGRASGL